MRRAGAAPLLPLLLLLAACRASPLALEAARDVVTRRTGTVAGLKDLRGTGPFTRYEVGPEEMLEVLAQACRRARDLRGRPVALVTVSRRYAEVTAKEPDPDAPDDPGYSAEWRSAVVATVHAIPGAPDACQVEIHAVRRSPLLGCSTLWERDLPRWIAETLAAREAPSPEVPSSGAPSSRAPSSEAPAR